MAKVLRWKMELILNLVKSWKKGKISALKFTTSIGRSMGVQKIIWCLVFTMLKLTNFPIANWLVFDNGEFNDVYQIHDNRWIR